MSINQIDNDLSWMDPLIEYLSNDTIPADWKEARGIKQQALWYILFNGQPYKKSFLILLLRCLRSSEVDYMLRKVHEGIWGHHIGSRSLAYKVLY